MRKVSLLLPLLTSVVRPQRELITCLIFGHAQALPKHQLQVPNVLLSEAFKVISLPSDNCSPPESRIQTKVLKAALIMGPLKVGQFRQPRLAAFARITLMCAWPRQASPCSLLTFAAKPQLCASPRPPCDPFAAEFMTARSRKKPTVTVKASQPDVFR